MNLIKHNRHLGIYVHIPFCVSKCIYCDFLSFAADDTTKEKYINALVCEIKEAAKKQCSLYPDTIVDTIFLGGGTPSILPAKYIVQIIRTIRENFFVSDNAEITMECNPGTLDKEKLDAYKSIGINRLSIGLQSPDNVELKNLGRIHTYEQFEESYFAARIAGFDNINIDIMSAIPFQTLEGYEKNLVKLLALKPEHISAYSLIVEENTKLYDMVNKSKNTILPTEDEEREMYYLTKKMLMQEGYYRYEISNYAKKGYECRHNCSYWERTEYLGFGLSAASLLDGVRFTNTFDMKSYLENPIENYEEHSVLTKEDAMSEYVFLGLRMMRGISKQKFEIEFGSKFDDIYIDAMRENLRKGLIAVDGDRVYLTDIGIDVSNSVMADFII